MHPSRSSSGDTPEFELLKALPVVAIVRTLHHAPTYKAGSRALGAGATLPSSRGAVVKAGLRWRRMPAKLSRTAGLEARDRGGGRRVTCSFKRPFKQHLNVNISLNSKL